MQYLFTQLQKARMVYTGVDLQGPINSAFTEPVITAGARTLCCPLRRVPSAGSFHQKTSSLLSSLQELSEERSYSESPHTVITICHFRSVVFPPASVIGPSGKAAVGSARRCSHGSVTSTSTVVYFILSFSDLFYLLTDTQTHTHTHTR